MNPYAKYVGIMDSAVLPPNQELASYIEKYVFYENENVTNDTFFETISNGRVEMFIHYNNSHLCVMNGSKEYKLNSFISGVSALGNTLKIKPMSGSECFKGLIVSLSFQGFYHFFDIPLKKITNKIVRLETLLGNKIYQLTEDISQASCTYDKRNILNKFFLKILESKKQKKNKFPIIDNLIVLKNGCLTVNDLSSQLKVSRRTVQRIFSEYIGIGPKDFLRIYRFNYACKLLSDYPDTDWSDIVCNCGYYDQMHFIHEFKQVMKCTPFKFLQISEGNFYFHRPIKIM